MFSPAFSFGFKPHKVTPFSDIRPRLLLYKINRNRTEAGQQIGRVLGDLRILLLCGYHFKILLRFVIFLKLQATKRSVVHASFHRFPAVDGFGEIICRGHVIRKGKAAYAEIEIQIFLTLVLLGRFYEHLPSFIVRLY